MCLCQNFCSFYKEFHKDFWKVAFNTVIIILWKSEKPLATAVVFWKLPMLFVIKRSMHLGFLGFLKHVLSLTKLLESYFESCPITNLLTFLSFNLFNIERVSHGSSKLPKLHVSSSKMALSKYTPLGVEFVLKKFYLNRLYICLLRFFFQILKNVDHPCTNGDLESFYCQSK